MGNVRAAKRFVKAAIIRVHIAARIAELIGARNVVDELREGVVGQNGEALMKPALQSNVSAVICRVPNGWINPGNIRELRKWPPRLRITRTHLIWRNLVECQVIRRQMVTDIGHVSHFDDCFACDFALDVEVVLIGSRSHLILLEETRCENRPLSRRNCAERVIERRSADRRKTVPKLKGAQELRLRNNQARRS